MNGQIPPNYGNVPPRMAPPPIAMIESATPGSASSDGQMRRTRVLRACDECMCCSLDRLLRRSWHSDMTLY